MNKIGLLAVLLLCGCHHKNPPQYEGYGPRPGHPCVISKGGMSDCIFNNGQIISKIVECDPENPFVACPEKKCRDCDCDKPERHDAQECKDLRWAIESYRRDCVGPLQGKWIDGHCDLGPTSARVKP